MEVLIQRVVELAGAGCVLVAALVVGTVAHELTHAGALRALGVPYELAWLPTGESTGVLAVSLRGSWATVTPRSIPADVPTCGLRCAAIAPFLLAAPLLLVLLGVLPDPVGTGDPYLTAVTVAWFACSLPSPQDFSLFWHAGRVRED